MTAFLRAHSYDAVARLHSELRVMPPHWTDAAHPWKFALLPDDLSPLWIGLLKEEHHDNLANRRYSEIGGWCASDEHGWLVRDTPHIYLNHRSIESACHEVGHALADAWHTDIEAFFTPDMAFYPYMASNPDEFFACAVVAFLRPSRADHLWNRDDLAKRFPDVFCYLNAQAEARA